MLQAAPPETTPFPKAFGITRKQRRVLVPKTFFTASLGIICAFAMLSAPQTARGQNSSQNRRLNDLLRSRRNMEEIDLSDTQKARIEEFRKLLRDRRTEMNRAIADFQTYTRDRIVAVLTRRQRERLSQLYYQGRGPRALEDATTAKELGMTEEQSKRIQEIRREAQEQYRKDRRNYRKIIKARDEKYLTVLTPRQRARWEKMVGPPRKRNLTLTSTQQRDLWDYMRKISPLTSRRHEAELALTDRQKEKIKELSRELWMNNPELQKIKEPFVDRYARVNDERRKTKIQQEMADAIARYYERHVEKIMAVLTRKQRDKLSRLSERLSQLRYRSRGESALPADDVAEKLGLTDAQKQKMKLLQEAARQAQREEERESRLRMQRIREKRNLKYLDVLTPLQRAKWEKMTGRRLKPLNQDI